MISMLVAGLGLLMLSASGSLSATQEEVTRRIPALTAAQWRDDLRFFAMELKRRHKNPFHHVNETTFDAAVQELEASLRDAKDVDVVVGLQRLAAMIGDGHTFIGTWDYYHRYPLEFFWFGKELRVIRASEPYTRALGTKLVAIGTCSIEEADRKIQTVIAQGENDWYRKNASASHLVQAESLAALRILPAVGKASFTFETDEGATFTLEIPPVAPGTTIEWKEMAASPLYRQRANEPLSYTFLPASRTVYVNFRSYDKLETRAAGLMAFLDEKKPENVIIDLRQNGGGNYDWGRRFLIFPISVRRDINRRGRLFVITGRGTFSAAMTNATDFHRETEALIIGEPTGANPNGYQELNSFMLPNSKIGVFCAICHYRFQEGELPYVRLDKCIDPDWNAYRAGEDPVLEWVLAQPPRD